MARLAAKGVLPYAGKNYSDGDIFEATDQDALILVELGKAVFAANPTPLKQKPIRNYGNRSFRSEG